MKTLIEILDELTRAGELVEKHDDGSLRCLACAHRCLIKPGKRGICQVRFNHGGELRVPSGYVAALQCDPIEKKPFSHLLPGSDALTFGMLGCDFHCGYCFTGETVVTTNHGPLSLAKAFELGASFEERPDGSIAYPGDLFAVTGSGSFHRVRAVFRHRYQGKLAVIKPYYLPALSCTPDHRIYATHDPKSDPVLIRAASITPQHYLAIPKKVISHQLQTLNLAETLSAISITYKTPWGLSKEDLVTILRETNAGKTSREIGERLGLDPSYVRQIRSKAQRGRITDTRSSGVLVEGNYVRFPKEHRPGIPCQIMVDKKFARLIGFYCAEGSIVVGLKRPNSLVLNFSFGKNEAAYCQEVHALLKEIFSIDARLVYRETTTGLSITKSSAAWLFWRLAGKGAKNKVIPQVIFDSPIEIAEAFLNGYIDGDGHRYENGKVNCTTVSKELTYGLAWLALKTGRMPAIYESSMTENGLIQNRKGNRAPIQYSVVWYDGHEINRKLIETSDYHLVPVKAINYQEFDGEVYNMEVEEEHNYLAGFFLVSNCQNWLTSQSLRDPGIHLSTEHIRRVSPAQLVTAALRAGAGVVASSYNEPLITSEWAVEVFKEAQRAGLRCVYISNGNATPEALAYLRPYLSGYKIDLKTMQDKRYRELGGVLQHVLESIRMARDAGLWVEVVTLVVPGFNDSPAELWDAARYIASVSPDIPWHVTAFHPDYRMTGPDPTSRETLLRAAEIGQEAGLNFVYAGNLPGRVGSLENTYCPHCQALLIERRGYTLTGYHLTAGGTCPKCGARIPGLWTDRPETVRLGGTGYPSWPRM